ncbi:hypothetical protein KUV65_15590 [Maritalea mobilis]|uniref:DUF6206 family protein n=1 Tax=Maritalea mobilis TaxID=483324 RepID=UPI001C96A82C|nr:DUF6206 family protein [Maritalea mobilis]MBY6202798.1 hypothetical protein [Maritalea mobilis]
MTELVGQVRAALAARKAEPASRLGYFCAPFRPAEGPLTDKVIKAYRGGRDPELLELLARRHEAYLDCLTLAGVRVPDTRFLLLNEHGFLRPVIVQDAVDTASGGALLSDVLPRVDAATARMALDEVSAMVAGFWRKVAQRPERIGLHAAVRDFALDDDGPLFLDTFPPLISYSREDMGRLLLRFSESGLIRGIGAILPGRVREIQDAWYSPSGSLLTLIEGAIRLRPAEEAQGLREWGAAVAADRLPDAERDRLVASLLRTRPAMRPSRRGLKLGSNPRPNA